MSITAYTYEELTINNMNEKTNQLCDAVGDYLLSTWGINFISLIVDGCNYESAEDDRITEDSELYKACQNLGAAKKILLQLRSENGGGADRRLESSFMVHFTDDPELKNNVTYRSTDYYDSESYVDMYLYNENGLQCMQYSDTADSVADIKEWYCFTPLLHICDEDQKENTELLEKVKAILEKLSILFGSDEDAVSNDWEDCGEIMLECSVRFATKDIPEIVELVNRLAVLFADSESAEVEFAIYAVPDGEGDYDFASVAFVFEGESVTEKYCRF